eukprot:1495307-Rhodomonas_salina.2
MSYDSTGHSVGRATLALRRLRLQNRTNPSGSTIHTVRTEHRTARYAQSEPLAARYDRSVLWASHSTRTRGPAVLSRTRRLQRPAYAMSVPHIAQPLLCEYTTSYSHRYLPTAHCIATAMSVLRTARRDPQSTCNTA